MILILILHNQVLNITKCIWFKKDEYNIDNPETIFLDFLIYDFFPNAKIKFEEDKKSLHVETRLGTVFILRPVDWENRRCEYRYLHKYDISLCIF